MFRLVVYCEIWWESGFAFQRKKYMIRCSEISLERRQGRNIWGKVEWCDHVLSGNFEVRKSIAVVV